MSIPDDAVLSRHDFVLLFDVSDGNPNGDPDAGNQPRVDPETGQGIVTDVAIKRKVRNYVGLKHGNVPPNSIYVREGAVLQEQREQAWVGVKGKRGRDAPKDSVKKARHFMCRNFYDVRTFGAVMSTNKNNAGQVRGPVQLTFARSINPVFESEHAITRVARETAARAAKPGQTEMASKHTISYGLYIAHGFVSPHLATGPSGTGFSGDDLSLLWEALLNMFEVDRSAARGFMATRRLIVFRHASTLGNAPAHELFDRVMVEQRRSVQSPRSFRDYSVTVDDHGLPPKIEVFHLR